MDDIVIEKGNPYPRRKEQGHVITKKYGYR